MVVSDLQADVRRHRRDQTGVLLALLGACAAVAVLGSLATRDSVQGWYSDADKPWFTPPDAVFGPVWTVLYVAMAVSAWLAWRRGASTGIWWVQLALNLAWTWIFFQGHAPTAAGIEIIVLLATIVGLIRLVWPHNRAAAAMLVPYAAWVTFATALTWTIAAKN